VGCAKGFLSEADCLIDVPQRTIAQTAGETVVFLFATISPCSAQQLQSAMDAANIIGL
jgi:hypothetical protein